MKWGVLAIGLIAVFPLAAWLRANSREASKIWMIVGFLILEHGTLRMTMALNSWSGGWRSYVQGFEISVLDFILLAIFISQNRARQSIPFKWSWALYLVAILISVIPARQNMPVMFYAWQLLRVFFVYVVISRACVDERVIPALLKGLAVGLCVQAGFAFYERFVQGVLQSGGTFGHQNFLGLISHFVVFPFFALLLAGNRTWFPKIIPMAGVVIVVLTTSRATLALAGLGYALTFMISAARKWTARKATVALVAALCVALLSPIVIASFQKRFENQGISEFFEPDDTRIAMERAARLMLEENPMGVGANHYAIVANTEGYNSRAGLSWANNRAHVHNIYSLVAAETGYFGILAFAILLLRPLQVAFVCGWRHRSDERGDLLLGFGVSLLIVYLHSFYEWIFITYQAQYIFGAVVAMIAGLAQKLGYWQRVQQQRAPVEGRELQHAR